MQWVPCCCVCVGMNHVESKAVDLTLDEVLADVTASVPVVTEPRPRDVSAFAPDGQVVPPSHRVWEDDSDTESDEAVDQDEQRQPVATAPARKKKPKPRKTARFTAKPPGHHRKRSESRMPFYRTPIDSNERICHSWNRQEGCSRSNCRFEHRYVVNHYHPREVGVWDYRRGGRTAP
jgi:hypothetical protein